MESGCTKDVVSPCPQLLDLIPQEGDWNLKRKDGSSEEKRLELRLGLGPPGEDNWSINKEKDDDESLLSLGYNNFSSSMNNNVKQTNQPVGSVLSTPWSNHHHHLQFPSHSLPVVGKESSQSQTCCNKAVDLQDVAAERKKTFKPPANTAVPLNTSQKRTAPGPVVGWPPIRSIRKNLANNTCSKPNVDSSHKVVANEKPVTEANGKGLFVKINMDGVPIGRKVDLKAYDSYEKLSTAVEELFRGLLAAQRDSCAGGTVDKQDDNRDGEKTITGVLDGSGEYTLVYEDNEGDSMLVGDVPWHMFVSTVKRLRALKSSELSALILGSSKQGKLQA